MMDAKALEEKMLSREDKYHGIPEFASWGKMSGAKSELSDGQIEERQKSKRNPKLSLAFFMRLCYNYFVGTS